MKSKLCIACVDAAKARIFAMDSATRTTGDEVTRLVEFKDLGQAGRRRRNSEKLADSRPGLSQDAGMPGSGHAVDDRRDAKTDEGDRDFAVHVTSELKAAVAELEARELVIAASPRMLGWLRQCGLSSVADSVREIDKNLSTLSASDLRDKLVADGAMPATV
ncbi:MAG: host attachment protein [Deltaproteobacteria bacterium]|jgi:protein required for attachment to host cells|nr:host attachment protein [Deltaproteobacteria bacterium]